VGCGCGGDLMKWHRVGAEVTMCDPDPGSLSEARRRARQMGLTDVQFFPGDILNATDGVQYDLVCYNFSLQYIFHSRSLFLKSIDSIKKCLKVGGRLVGCIPDSDYILMNTPFKDSLGNTVTRGSDSGRGNWGEFLNVRLSDTPYYSGAWVSEPIAYKDLLVTHLGRLGIRLVAWEPFDGPAEISKFYSRFIFLCE
jgi:SAM-dependent methyltransferase